ncbi:Maf family protein [Verrucomicrobia bacterium]|nr:Maf family protein [Verrucomicrobiota bacterium]
MILPPIILASGSPRRREILSRLGFIFEVETADVVELSDGMLPAELCQENALLKAQSVADKNPDSLVIGSDTVVCLEGRIFGKPLDLAEACSFLEQLQGKTHQVLSGMVLICQAKKVNLSFFDATNVTFRSLSSETIKGYLQKIDPLDKAGGYAIQDHGDMIVESIDGSMDNVIGFPTERFLQELELLPL